MGYFPNGTASLDYESRYCDHCVHQRPDSGGCAVWLLHMLRNYDDSDRHDSPLHVLIPLSEDGLDNEKCTMFYEGASDE